MRQAGGHSYRRSGGSGRGGRLVLLGLSLLALEACSSASGVYERMAQNEGVVANGLPADRSHAAYTDVALVGGTETPAPPPRALDYAAAAEDSTPAPEAAEQRPAEERGVPRPEAVPDEVAAAEPALPAPVESIAEAPPAPPLEPAMETLPPDPMPTPQPAGTAEVAPPPVPATPDPAAPSYVPPPMAAAESSPGSPGSPGSYEPLPLPDMPPPAYAPPPPPPPAVTLAGPEGPAPVGGGLRPLRGVEPVPPAADIPIAPVPPLAAVPPRPMAGYSAGVRPYEREAPPPPAAPLTAAPSLSAAPELPQPTLPPVAGGVAGGQDLEAIAAETYARRLRESAPSETPAETAPVAPGTMSPSAAYLSAPNLPPHLSPGASDLALPAGDEPAAVIRFAYGSAELGREDFELLREVAEIHRGRGGRVRVVGHSSADSSTDQDKARPARLLANFEQSQQRAEVVAAALRAYGVPAEALLVEARGDSAPLYRETTPAGAFGNRRVEIFLE